MSHLLTSIKNEQKEKYQYDNDNEKQGCSIEMSLHVMIWCSYEGFLSLINIIHIELNDIY